MILENLSFKSLWEPQFISLEILASNGKHESSWVFFHFGSHIKIHVPLHVVTALLPQGHLYLCEISQQIGVADLLQWVFSGLYDFMS